MMLFKNVKGQWIVKVAGQFYWTFTDDIEIAVGVAYSKLATQ